jgi:hypothetical protein
VSVPDTGYGIRAVAIGAERGPMWRQVQDNILGRSACGFPSLAMRRSQTRHFWRKLLFFEAGRDWGLERFTIPEFAMFKLRAYDPIGVAVIGFGILVVVALALTF